MDLRVEEITSSLEKGADGIWRSDASEVASISYPDEGNRDALALEERSFWFEHRNRCIVTLAKGFPPQGPIFDIGGGNGFVSKGLLEAGFETVLVEPGEEGARNARSRGIDNVVCATLETSGFADHSLPAAGMFDVLEHIEADDGFLRMLHSKLVPGGRLFITVPAYGWLWSVEDEYGGHYRRYRMSQLKSLLKSTGFAVECATYIFGLAPLPIFLMRSLPSRLGLMKEFSLARAKREHAGRPGLGGAVVDWALRRELRKIRAGREIGFGGTCLVVAKAAPESSTDELGNAPSHRSER